MAHPLEQLFDDAMLREKVRTRLPRLFSIAQEESARARRTGMEVGSIREQILIGLLIYKFGRENVNTQVPITEKGLDVWVYTHPVSIKTVTGDSGVKVSWTVDASSARQFASNYRPQYEILLAQIKWDQPEGGLFWIPIQVQSKVFGQLGWQAYLSLPKEGTNPRGVESSRKAMRALLGDADTRRIEIYWEKTVSDYDPYKRWVDYWAE